MNTTYHVHPGEYPKRWNILEHKKRRHIHKVIIGARQNQPSPGFHQFGTLWNTLGRIHMGHIEFWIS